MPHVQNRQEGLIERSYSEGSENFPLPDIKPCLADLSFLSHMGFEQPGIPMEKKEFLSLGILQNIRKEAFHPSIHPIRSQAGRKREIDAGRFFPLK